MMFFMRHGGVAVAVVAALLLSSPASASGDSAGWPIVAMTTNNSIFRMQPVANRTPAGPGRVRIWDRVDYQKPENGVSHSLRLSEYDCRNRKSRFLQWTNYSATGNPILTSTTPDEWIFVIPGTAGEALLRAACTGV